MCFFPGKIKVIIIIIIIILRASDAQNSFGRQQKGKAVSKQRLSHWIVDAINLAFQVQDLPRPFLVRAHSTRGVASSWALAIETH